MVAAAVTNSQRVQRFFEFLLPKAAATTRADSRPHTGRNPVPAPVVETAASKSRGVQSAAFAIRPRVL